MPSKTSHQSESTVLLNETVSTRKLPVNFDPGDLPLFGHELEKQIPQTSLLELSDVRISSDGFLTRGYKLLPESFAFPRNRAQWKLRGLVKFFSDNYVLRRPRAVKNDVLWVTDDWSLGYFHWLTDALSRLYVVRDRLDDLELILPWNYEAADFVSSSLKAFNVQPKFIGREEVLVCKRVIMPTHTAPSGHYNEETIRGVRNLLLQHYRQAEGVSTDGRVYVSRKRATKRRIANEEEVIDVLKEFGFQIVYAEDVTFDEQVEIYSRARFLLSNHGAGLTNMLFMPEGSSVLELRHETDCINNCYFTLSSALNLNYYYQKCASDRKNQDPHFADLLVDPAELKNNLRLILGS
jgi:hypothetical protein